MCLMSELRPMAELSIKEQIMQIPISEYDDDIDPRKSLINFHSKPKEKYDI